MHGVHAIMKVLTGLVLGCFLHAPIAHGKPEAPAAFCRSNPSSPLCSNGSTACTVCHAAAPALNPYGSGLAGVLGGGNFNNLLPDAIAAVSGADSDGDGFSNGDEIKQGSLPGDRASRPTTGGADKDKNLSCEEKKERTGMNLCGVDLIFLLKRIKRDFCGESPSFEEVEDFRGKSADDQQHTLDTLLSDCTLSEFWRGKDGVLWQMAHLKIEPLQTLKSGENRGEIPLGDYDDDYNLFVYHQIDGHDARGILVADYFVRRDDDPSRYEKIDEMPVHPNAGGVVRLGASLFNGRQQWVPKAQRAGLLTTLWFAVTRTMFTSIPRASAAAALRRFLSIDLAKSQGLVPPQDPAFRLVDYDAKGVTDPACAYCHNTLDPLAYPFTKYNGLSFRTPGNSTDVGGIFSEDSSGLGIPPFIPPALIEAFVNNSQRILLPGMYKERRIPILAEMNQATEPNLATVPERGFFMGKPVANLKEWAAVAANSDDFAKATVHDYWQLLVGSAPNAANQAEFDQLWKSFRGEDSYNVEAMLHRLIKTEAYGAP